MTPGFKPFTVSQLPHCWMLHVASACKSCYMLACCWELLHPFAHHCQHQRSNSQHCWGNNVGRCCVWLSYVQTDATLLANSSRHCWMLGDEVWSHRANALSNTELFYAWWPGRNRTSAWSQKRKHWGRDCVQTALREGIFDLPHPLTPGTGPLETNPHPRARRAGLVPGVARGNGYRSNWTMHNLVLNVLHLHSSETVTCSYLSIM